MGLWNSTNTFASLGGNQPASKLDTNFSELAIMPQYASGVSGTNTILLTVPLTFSAYAAGMSFMFTAANTTTSATVTINVNSVGSKTVITSTGATPQIGAITAGGAYQVYYDGTSFVLMNPALSNANQVNRMINGGFKIDQRNGGVQQLAIATGTYMTDRWRFDKSNTAVVTAQQSTDVPTTPGIWKNSQSITVTTADGAVTAGDYSTISQYIEGYNITDLIGQTFTLQFWVKSSKTGTHCVSFRNKSTADRSYVMEYSVTNANTWQQVTLTVTGGLTTAGTWDYTTGIGLAVSFCMMGGSTFQTTANAWQTGNFLATANQVNVMDTVGNVFKITAVQLYLGTFCPTYEERLYAGELQQCQRYYFVGQGGEVGARYASVAGTWNATTIRFPTTMRIAPLVTPSAFTYSNCSAGAASAIKTDGFSMSVSTSGTATYGLTAFTFACDAEIT